MDIIRLSDIDLHKFGAEIQIAGTIWTGDSTSFITLIPGKTDDLSNLKLMPLTLSEWETLLRQTDLLETEMLAKDPTGKIVKILYRKSQRQIDSYLQWEVFKHDNYSCRYCGRTGIPLTVDHIDLWEEGGASIKDNLLSTCRSCNKDRGRLHYDEWLKSPIYLKKSKNLLRDVWEKNEALLQELPRLQNLRVYHVRSR